MSISGRFWSLVMLIFGAAVIGSGVAVWMTATPYLESVQNRTVADQAISDASTFEAKISERRQFLKYLAGEEDVISVVLGYLDETDIVSDLIDGKPIPAGISQIRLFDAFGDSLAAVETRATDHVFSETDYRGIVDFIIDEDRDILSDSTQALPIFLQRSAESEFFLIAVPVISRGLVEGALAAEIELNVGQSFRPNDLSTFTTIADPSEAVRIAKANPGTQLVEVQDGWLSLVFVPDAESVAAAGRQLLFNSVTTVFLVLAFAFGLFALLGHSAIVTPHIRMAAQQKSLNELAAIAKNANDAIVMTDLNERIVWTNPAFERLSGRSSDSVLGHRPGPLLQCTETDNTVRKDIRAALNARKPVKREILNSATDGTRYWISISIAPLSDQDGNPYGFMAISSDVTKEREHRQEILEAKLENEYQAHHDALTGLANRRFFSEELQRRAERGEGETTLAHIDLDHFKTVNDTLGHAAGDFVLCEVSEILKSNCRDQDVPARLGGDEFAILFGSGTTIEQAAEICRSIIAEVTKPFWYKDKSLRVGCSFGLAGTENKLVPVGGLEAAADAALYVAKDAGRGCIARYERETHEFVLFRRDLAARIQKAIEDEEFEPFFQPQVSAIDGRLTGVEALARWPSKDAGILYPDTFLPIAKQMSLVEKIDDIIFRKGIEQINTLRAEGFDVPRISFNVTAERVLHLANSKFVASIPENRPDIAFEVLESVLIEEQSDDFLFALDNLKELGFGIEIDDFGSGHASVVSLVQLQPETMKIDRRLVMPIVESETSQDILKSIVQMAKVLNLKITAEGVETKEHADMLAEMGCHVLQGYYFGKPADINGLRDFIVAQNDAGTQKQAGA